MKMRSMDKVFLINSLGIASLIINWALILQFFVVTKTNGEILPPGNQCIRHSNIKHKPEGPICQCKVGYCLVEKPEGMKCKKDYSRRYNKRGSGKCERSYSIIQIPTTTTPIPEIVTVRRSPTRSNHERSGRQDHRPFRVSDQGSFGFDSNFDYSDEEEYDSDNEEVFYNNDPMSFPTTENTILPILNGQFDQVSPMKKEAVLPRLNSSISIKQENCLKSDRIYWPDDDRCHTLLQQGPCLDDEWLILKQSNNDIVITCQKRPCPCRTSDPNLCEVLITKKVTDCGQEREEKACHVALAAEQDGICDDGEQIIVTPFGDGICGCRLSPVHMKWNGDGKCHPLLYQGSPCPENQSLQFSKIENRALCVATLCKPGYVLYEDGGCYRLDTQGPCEEVEKLGINTKTHELECMSENKKLQRSLWGLFPSVRGIRRLPQKDLSFLQASPSECNTIDGNCLLLSMGSGNDNMDMVIDDPQEIPCDEIFCSQGYEAVEKPEGCLCIKSRPTRNRSGTSRPSLMRPNLIRSMTTERPENLRLVDEKAKKYLIWLHDFIPRRQNFTHKVMGRI